MPSFFQTHSPFFLLCPSLNVWCFASLNVDESIFFVWTAFKTNRKKIKEGTRQKRYYTKQYLSECSHMHMAISDIISLSLYEGVSKMKKKKHTTHYTTRHTTQKVRSNLAMGHIIKQSKNECQMKRTGSLSCAVI